MTLWKCFILFIRCALFSGLSICFSILDSTNGIVVGNIVQLQVVFTNFQIHFYLLTLWKIKLTQWGSKYSNHLITEHLITEHLKSEHLTFQTLFCVWFSNGLIMLLCVAISWKIHATVMSIYSDKLSSLPWVIFMLFVLFCSTGGMTQWRLLVSTHTGRLYSKMAKIDEKYIGMK